MGTDQNAVEHGLTVSLAEAYNTFHGLQLFDYAGDISVRRDGDTFHIRRARVSINADVVGDSVRTTPDDILTMDLANRVVAGDGAIPDEAIIHSTIYTARPSVQSVIHCHARMLNTLEVAGAQLRPVSIRGLDVIGPGVPRYTDSDPIMRPDQANALIDVMGDSVACIQPTHGIVMIGSSIAEACLRVINVERSAAMQYTASLLGTPKDLPPSTIAIRTNTAQVPGYLTAVWSYYVQLVAAGDTRGVLP
jgi:ribulose-5-phosphate 4-epimerase/fuculose-1-phosphate aldolase